MTEKEAAHVPGLTRQQELELWKDWSKTQSPKVLGDLIGSFNPVIQMTVNKFQDVPLPRSAVEAEAKKQFINAMQTYNPQKGAALGTHVNNYMKKVNRFIYEHQNVGRIPEHRITQIGAYQSARSELENSLAREPSAAEIADSLAWSLPEVERMERELKREVPETALESEFSFESNDPGNIVLNYIYYELSPQEKVVFEYLTGWAGKPKIPDSQIASKIGVSPARVRKIKSEISKKIQRRMP